MVSTISQADVNYLYDDSLKEKCLALCDKIRKAIKAFLLGSLQDYRKGKRTFEGDNLVFEMGQRVRESSSKQDSEFIDQFVQT